MGPELNRRINSILERDPRIVGAYLFGSRVRGDDSEGSDLDLAVLYDGPLGLDRSIQLEDAMERASGRAVDLLDLARANPFLALEAVRGERIFVRDERRLDELDLYVMRRAGDLAPFERQRRRKLLEVGRS